MLRSYFDTLSEKLSLQTCGNHKAIHRTTIKGSRVQMAQPLSPNSIKENDTKENMSNKFLAHYTCLIWFSENPTTMAPGAVKIILRLKVQRWKNLWTKFCPRKFPAALCYCAC